MAYLGWAVFVVFGLLATFNWVNAADTCYSGQNSRYAPKQCSSGGSTTSYTCQKFVCEGGKSPFTLRTCANANTGCIAGPRICQFSGGHGKCQRCENNLCNE
uniref:Secreted protein n=1 Tax=Panagrellus redivivus TaxID=6233 RepID=A0A7E4ZYI5_PANRE